MSVLRTTDSVQRTHSPTRVSYIECSKGAAVESCALGLRAEKGGGAGSRQLYMKGSLLQVQMVLDTPEDRATLQKYLKEFHK